MSDGNLKLFKLALVSLLLRQAFLSLLIYCLYFLTCKLVVQSFIVWDVAIHLLFFQFHCSRK